VAKGIKSSINGNTLICTIPYYNSFTAHKSNNGRTAPADYERKDAEESDRVVYAGNSNDKPNRQPHKKNKNRAELNKIREIILGGDEQEEKVKNLKPVVEDQHAPNGQDDLVEDQEGARLLAALYPSTGNPAVKAPKIKVKKDAFTPMKMPLALVITIACFFAFMALYKYFQKKGSPTLTDTESIEIISRRNLGNKQQLALVKVMGDTLLISSGDQGISLLSRIGINGDDDKVSQFLQKDNVSLEGPFAQQLKRAKNELVQKQRPIDSMVDSINDKIRQLQSI